LVVENILGWTGDACGLPWVALRYFNAAGADPDGEIGEAHDPETHLIPLVINAALGRRNALTVFGNDYPTVDGTAVRDYVHVCDLAAAHVQALVALAEGRGGFACNLGAGRGYSVLEVIATVERIAGRTVPYTFAPRRPGDAIELVADASFAKTQLHWSPQLSSLDDIVSTALRWHQRGERQI
jgi:UDP-glucose 4-epimerase